MIINRVFPIVFQAGVWLAYPFNRKIRKFVRGRKDVFRQIQQFSDSLATTDQVAWFHCASLGEFEQGRPVMERLKKEFPSIKIFLTFFSPSGYEVRKNYPIADCICYLPTDNPSHAKKLVQLVKPVIAFFVKYEYWFFYLSELEKQNIPALAISVIFLPHYTPFRWYGKFYHETLHKIRHYFFQDQKSATLIQQIGIQHYTVAGDTRFDRVAEICAHVQPIAIAERFKAGGKLMIIGSSWPEDMEILIPFIQENQAVLKFIIAPHTIDESEIKHIENALPGQTIRYSRAGQKELYSASVLIIDNIGMLTALYQYGDFAFVGGAFKTGLHNILEPATFGMPIFFGNKKYHTFHEAAELINLEVAFPIENQQELKKKVTFFMENEAAYRKAKATCKQYIATHKGATDKIMDYVKTIL